MSADIPGDVYKLHSKTSVVNCIQNPQLHITITASYQHIETGEKKIIINKPITNCTKDEGVN